MTEAPRTVREGAGAFPTSAARRSATVALIAEIVNVHLDSGYAEASRRHAEAPLPAESVRRRRSMAIVTCLLLGVILAVGYRQAVRTAPEAAETRQALLVDVERRTAAADDLQREADRLREEVTERRAAANAGSSAGEAAEQRARDLEAATGFAKVHGPGIEVVLGDGPAPTDPVTGQVKDIDYPGRVQDGDLQRLVNALWESGAEAVAISGQRITPITAIRSAGEAVQVDQRPVASPYTVQAIGDAELLRARLAGSPTGDELDTLVEQYGMKFAVAIEDDLELPAATVPTLIEATSPASASPTGSPSARPSTRRSRTATPGVSPSDGPSSGASVNGQEERGRN